jgi:four helix bundle protein
MANRPNNRTTEQGYSYRNLVLWQEAQGLAQEIAVLVDALPTRRSLDVVARQLMRSATSIAANIAEGHARFSFGAYRNHLSIARGSAAEADSWLDLLSRLGHLPPAQSEQLHQRCRKLIGALTGRMRDLDRQKERAVKEERSDYMPSDAGHDEAEPRSDVPLFGGSAP